MQQKTQKKRYDDDYDDEPVAEEKTIANKRISEIVENTTMRNE